jgi:HSP20 family molecular chaperone IbpA
MAPLTYLLPLKLSAPPPLGLTTYLRDLSTVCPLVIVDGSPADMYEWAHLAWREFAVHLPPDPALACANGKVQGVLTGLAHVDTDVVVIADDDVRYTDETLAAVAAGLDEADLVVPQNYFDPLPWHARWDTARTLLNRMSGGDFPGTLGVRTEILRTTGGYDGDVLFENLELMRTVDAIGGTCRRLPDVFVAREPPTTRHFFSQRVRQAYDEFARPARLVVWLSVLPAAMLAARRRPGALVAAAATCVAAAEFGRRRHRGRSHFPWTSSLLAPAWLLERAVCSWLALAARARGGVQYHGARMRRAATPAHRLRRVHRSARDAHRARQDIARATWNNGHRRRRGESNMAGTSSERPNHAEVVEATEAAAAAMTLQRVPINAYTTSEAFIIVAPLPAVRASDVHVDLGPDTVRFVAGLRSAGPRDYLINEWDYGGYEREVALPEGFGGSVEAVLANGQLTVRVTRGHVDDTVQIQPTER